MTQKLPLLQMSLPSIFLLISYLPIHYVNSQNLTLAPTTAEPTGPTQPTTPAPTAPSFDSLPTPAPSAASGSGPGTQTNDNLLYGPGQFSSLDWILSSIILIIIMSIAIFCYCCIKRKMNNLKQQSSISMKSGLNQTEMVSATHTRSSSGHNVRPKVATSFGSAHELPKQDSTAFDAAVTGVALTKTMTNLDIGTYTLIPTQIPTSSTYHLPTVAEEIANESAADDDETEALNQSIDITYNPSNGAAVEEPNEMEQVFSASKTSLDATYNNPEISSPAAVVLPEVPVVPAQAAEAEQYDEEYEYYEDYEEYEEYEEYEQPEPEQEVKPAVPVPVPPPAAPKAAAPKPPPPKPKPAPPAVVETQEDGYVGQGYDNVMSQIDAIISPEVEVQQGIQGYEEVEEPEAEVEIEIELDPEYVEEVMYLSIEEAKKQTGGEKEKYLNDEDFQSVFGMSKDDFYKQPGWKQKNQKKSKGFF